MRNKLNKENTLIFVTLIILFSFLLLFFIKIHPIFLADTDDWRYAFYHRAAIPLWNNWNPIRVFPEVVMPLASEIGAYLIFPILGEYFRSLSIVYAFLVSIVSVILFYMIYLFFNNYKYDVFSNLSVMLFFVICHFWIFRTANENNQYMLRGGDACVYFYYVIPNLLNSILVIWMLLEPEVIGYSRNSFVKKSIFIVLIYFCVFSNIWAGVIISAYVGSVLFIALIKEICSHKFNLIKYFKHYSVGIFVICLWLVSQLFELNGGRATSILSNSFSTELRRTILVLLDTVKSINRMYAIVYIGVVIIGFIIMSLKNIERNKKMKDILMHILLSAALMLVYLVLSCAKAGAWYISRTDVLYGVFFFCMIIEMIFLKELIDSISFVKVIIPLMLLLIFVECDTSGKTYLESNSIQIPPEVILNINNDIVEQVLKAEKEGKLETIVYVPVFDAVGGDNWPYAVYATEFIGDHLYKMGITKSKIKIEQIVPLNDKNLEFNIH